MLFEKELQKELVPEWRAKYLDYKLAKTKLKACEQALKKADQTPKFFPTPQLRRQQQRPTVPSQLLSSSSTRFPGFEDRSHGGSSPEARILSPAPRKPDSDAIQALQKASERLQITDVSSRNANERQPLKQGQKTEQRGGSDGGYGSFNSTPRMKPSASVNQISEDVDPKDNSHTKSFPKREEKTSDDAARQKKASPGNSAASFGLTRSYSLGLSSLKLPGPAIGHPNEGERIDESRDDEAVQSNGSAVAQHSNESAASPAFLQVHRSDHTLSRRAFSTPYTPSIRSAGILKRVFSKVKGPPTPAAEVPLEAYREFDARRADFFSFLDEQLSMVEDFYKIKEDAASERFDQLKEQLRLMKERQTLETAVAVEERRNRRLQLSINGNSSSENSDSVQKTGSWTQSLADRIGLNRFRASKTESNPKKDLANGSNHRLSHVKSNKSNDYERRTALEGISYKEGKSKLKHAVQEFYRNLELLKSYAMLNREAFRKIVKKYDKTIQTRQTGRYMSEKVDKAWFVQSHKLDSQISAAEDLYANYFEKGSHKIAANKLRVKHNIDYSPSAFRTGFLLGVGAVLGARGLAYSAGLANGLYSVQVSFLLQIYGGYFLALSLFLLFCLDCRFWVENRINYIFIFEFDPRSRLDWRQLAEIPSLLWFLLGLVLWLNFSNYGGGTDGILFLYWPIILVGVTAIILFMPLQRAYYYLPSIKNGSLDFKRHSFDLIYPHSRSWWAYSNFRLYTGGLYPVEFRDFFLGDMYCSLTYAMGNIELFFCLYANQWSDPPQCNSSHSMLLGFFTCLPGIWRALQCLRRYRDSGMAFPHLANCGKYVCTILFYMTLSLYRLDETPTRKILFIVFGTLNGIYVSFWDILIDWSLAPRGERGLLPEKDLNAPTSRLGFPKWTYYPAVIVDPLLRFNWIFYAIFTGELQHSALLSFFVSLSEIFRRSFWALFRVENEHMTNVGMFRASRDIPLPFDTSITQVSTMEASDLESQTISTPRRVGTTLGTAHAHDFERRRPTTPESDDEDDDELEESVED